jgi:hypothetical protein
MLVERLLESACAAITETTPTGAFRQISTLMLRVHVVSVIAGGWGASRDLG